MKSFTPLQLSRFRTHYARMRDCGPLQRSTIRAILHQCEDSAIQQLAEAGIEHISMMARTEWYQRQIKEIKLQSSPWRPRLPSPQRTDTPKPQGV